MSRLLSIASKRAVSEMLSYVLVLIIVIALSVAVYAYLQLQAPKERLSCNNDVLLIVDPADTTCVLMSNGDVQITALLENRGKRSISGAYLRLGPPGTKIRTLINEEDIFFGLIPESASSELLPGKTFRYTTLLVDFDSLTNGTNFLEVQPVFGEPNNLVICEQATLVQKIQCERSTS